jgi:polyisoprenoid-binding protein YceI
MKKLIWLIIIIAVVVIGVSVFDSEDRDDLAVTSDGASVVGGNNTNDSIVAGVDEVMYSLDAANSKFEWAAERIIGNAHVGTVSLKSGQLIQAPNGEARGEFVVDMTTITESNNNERFLGHVRSDDFFGVEKFPTARIVIKSITKVSENTRPATNQYSISGDLMIRDKANPVSFIASETRTDDGLNYVASFSIDRTKWDIVFDSGSVFTTLGDKAIRDEINFTLNLALRKGK